MYSTVDPVTKYLAISRQIKSLVTESCRSKGCFLCEIRPFLKTISSIHVSQIEIHFIVIPFEYRPLFILHAHL